MSLFNRFKIESKENTNIAPLKVYELWMDHTYRTYEPNPKDGYKSYMFDGVLVKERNFAPIYPSKYKDAIGKPIGDVFSVEISSFILNEKSYKILCPYLENHSQIFKIRSIMRYYM